MLGFLFAAAIRVACIGDSITQGIGTPQSADKSFPESYPAQLGKLLGPGYEVENWGVGGRTLIRKSDKIDYGRALKGDPDVVVICAGTNDSKPYCWDNYADDYAPDYEKMVCEFKSRPSRPRVIVCLPPPVFNGGQWGIRESVLENEIRPKVRAVAASTGAEVLDLATPFRDHPELFPDRVHPNPAGAGKIAALVAARIRGESAAPKAVEKSADVKGLSSFRLFCADPGEWTFDLGVCEESPEVSLVTVSLASAKPSDPPRFELAVEVPQREIRHLWTANDNHLAISPFITKTKVSAIGEGLPLYSYLDDASAARLTLALDECRRKVVFAGGVREVGCAIFSRMKFFEQAEAPLASYTLTVRVDRRTQFFGDSVREAVSWVEKTAQCTPAVPPAAAFDPVYSTWYAFHQDLTDREIESECAKAAALGLKTVILDDGWQTEKAEGGYRRCGDWVPAPKRFPDMAEHVRRLHERGLKVMLWYSVPFVGYESQGFGRAKSQTLFDYRAAKAVVLDPRFPGVRKNIVRTYVKALKDWDLDGFKLDFIDRFKLEGLDPALADNYAGRDTKSVPEAVDRLLSEIRAALVAVKPDVLLEFRQPYVGPAIRSYGNMMRAGDCPGDARQNRTAIANLRLVCGASAVHSDMLEWSRETTAEDAAHAILNALFGTIQYSVRLQEAPEDHLKMMAHWIGFAEAHRATLLKGAFRPYGPELGYPRIEAESAVERIVAVYQNELVVPSGALDRKVIVVNATSSDELALDMPAPAAMTAFDTFGRQAGKSDVVAGLARVRIPVSGYCTLERK